MNRKAIQNTVVYNWKEDEKVYECSSVLLPICIGIADTQNEAWKIFNEHLDEIYIAHLEGKLASTMHKTPGRPKRSKVSLHAEVLPATRALLKEKCSELQISMGDLVDYLVAEHNAVMRIY